MVAVINKRKISVILADDHPVVRDGLAAMVVVDDGALVGLLDAEAVIQELAEHYEPATGLMGDETISGRSVIDQLTVVCTTCHTPNRYTEIDIGVTRCSGGHLLTITWA